MPNLTRTIAGQPVTLEAGQRYRATWPMFLPFSKLYPVTVYKVTESGGYPIEDVVLIFGHDFTREQANEALAELYAGVVSGIYFEWREN